VAPATADVPAVTVGGAFVTVSSAVAVDAEPVDVAVVAEEELDLWPPQPPSTSAASSAAGATSRARTG
jgi:hypothetical protein